MFVQKDLKKMKSNFNEVASVARLQTNK